MRLSECWRRERLGECARKIHLAFQWRLTALGKHLAGRPSLLPRAKLHDTNGRKHDLTRYTHADKATVRRHILARVACVDDAPAVLRDKLDKVIEQLFLTLRHFAPLL